MRSTKKPIPEGLSEAEGSTAIFSAILQAASRELLTSRLYGEWAARLRWNTCMLVNRRWWENDLGISEYTQYICHEEDTYDYVVYTQFYEEVAILKRFIFPGVKWKRHDELGRENYFDIGIANIIWASPAVLFLANLSFSLYS